MNRDILEFVMNNEKFSLTYILEIDKHRICGNNERLRYKRYVISMIYRRKRGILYCHCFNITGSRSISEDCLHAGDVIMGSFCNSVDVVCDNVQLFSVDHIRKVLSEHELNDCVTDDMIISNVIPNAKTIGYQLPDIYNILITLILVEGIEFKLIFKYFICVVCSDVTTTFNARLNTSIRLTISSLTKIIALRLTI